MQKLYRVTLTAEERRDLQALVSKGKAAARKLTRARVLLLADQAEGGPAMQDAGIVKTLGCGFATVARSRRQFVEEGPAIDRLPEDGRQIVRLHVTGGASFRQVAARLNLSIDSVKRSFRHAVVALRLAAV